MSSNQALQNEIVSFEPHVQAYRTTNANLATQVRKDSGDTNITYIGKAVIGSDTSSAVWQVARLDATGGELVKTWADGDASYNNIFDNRESLTYL